tara:strand:- start:253 stop:630 length:378 start_codon:yes stop_codon:yes gene_type:complete
MTKEELKQEITKLEQHIESHAEQVKDLEHDLRTTKRRLADADKHKLPSNYFTKIEEAVESTIENFDFNNTGSYSTEFEMDYDNTVSLNNIEFDAGDELAEEICRNIEDLFGVAEESDDTNTVPSE